MQLDRTHVVIRLRTLTEIGDLAMVMIRRYPGSLLIGFAAGALPWVIANALLLSWIPINEAAYGLDDSEAAYELSRYCAWMMLLVVLQTPAAGVLTTLYLGQAVFEHRPTWASVFGEAKRQFWRWFGVLGIKRLAVLAMLIPLLRWGQEAHGFFDVAIPLGLLVALAIFRSSRPFVPEILLLEQCPVRSDSQAVITMGRRSKSLHSPVASDLGGRFLAVSFILFWLMLSALYTMIWFRGIATGVWNWDLFVYLVLFPLALWIVGGVSVLVRLLNYLDTRIRLEGWEVELAIRAEAMRQFGDEAGWIKVPGEHPISDPQDSQNSGNSNSATHARASSSSAVEATL
ncbi:MAG: hypothetical protein MI861_24315 [Pirellulales bacterium]|nr:hypothetical protein [Pirellulales bacterium]